MPNYRRRFSDSQRRAMIAMQDYYRALQARRERLINYLFYGKPLVVTSIWLRIFYVLFFLWTAFLDGQPGSTREERVEYCSSHVMKTGRKFKLTTFVVNFKTNFGYYEARRDYQPLPVPLVGDTLEITYSLFGKPTAFKPLYSEDSFGIWINWVPIVFVGLLTAMSFAAYQGYDYTTNIVIVVACIADVIMLGYYFIFC